MTSWLKVTEKDAKLVKDPLRGAMDVAYGYAC